MREKKTLATTSESDLWPDQDKARISGELTSRNPLPAVNRHNWLCVVHPSCQGYN